MNWYNFELQCIKEHQKFFPDKTVYHWSDIPEEELILSGWIDNLSECAKIRKSRSNYINSYCEYGLDGIAKDKDGRYDFLQMKYWPSATLYADSLGTFFLTLIYSLGNENNVKGYIYHQETIFFTDGAPKSTITIFILL